MSLALKEELSNLAQTTLNGNITNSQTTLVVTSATKFPTTGNFRLLIDSEIMLVTAVSGTTFTVSRAQESTTAASHTSGATVTAATTAGQFDGLRASFVTKINAADVPTSSGNLSRFHFPADNDLLWDDDTASMTAFARLRKMLPPGLSSLAGHVTTGLTLTDTGMWHFQAMNTGSTNLRGYNRSIPSLPFSVITYVLPLFYDYINLYHTTAFPQGGLYVYDSTSGKVCSFFLLNGGGDDTFQVTNWSSMTSFSSNLWSLPVHEFFGGYPSFMKMQVTSTALNFYVSKDGFNWIQVYTVTKTTFFSTGPDHIGLAVNCDGGLGSEPVGMSFLTWEEGT